MSRRPAALERFESYQDVLDAAALACGVRPDQLLEKDRDVDRIFAMKLAAYVLIERGLSGAEVGKILGRHRSVPLAAATEIEDLLGDGGEDGRRVRELLALIPSREVSS